MHKTTAIKYNKADIVVITLFIGSQLKFKVLQYVQSYAYNIWH